MKTVDIIIVTFNDLNRLKNLVHSIREHTDTENHDYRITIVDNSTDGNQKCASAFASYPQVRVFDQSTNLGWVGAVNLGFSAADREVIVVMNDDIVVEKGWLDSMVKILEVGVAKIVLPVATAGSRGSMDWVNLKLEGKYPIYSQFKSFHDAALCVREKFKDKFNLLRKPLSFYVFAMLRSTQLELGVLDEQFNHGGWDDDDYCRRVFDAGGNIAIVLDTLVWHQVSASGGGYGKRLEKLNENERKFNRKWNIPQKPSVLIACPNMGSVKSELFDFLSHVRSAKFEKYKVEVMNLSFTSNLSPVDRARNIIAKDFLESKHDFLLMIDEDIIPPVDVIEMCLHDKPVIAATCFGWVSNEEHDTGVHPVIFDYNPEDGKYMSAKRLNERGVIECDAVGTGCIMIRRDVLQEIGKPWFKMEFNENFEMGRGEDIYFCAQAQKHGFKIYADKDKVCDHVKAVNLKIVHEQQWKYILKTRDKIASDAAARAGEKFKRFMEQFVPTQPERPRIIIPNNSNGS